MSFPLKQKTLRGEGKNAQYRDKGLAITTVPPQAKIPIERLKFLIPQLNFIYISKLYYTLMNLSRGIIKKDFPLHQKGEEGKSGKRQLLD